MGIWYKERGERMVKPSDKKIIWTVWILILSLGLWFSYNTYPPQIRGNEWEIFSFLVFMTVVASMPMIINGTPVFFLQWATLSVFLIFGLFIEIILVQIALLAVLYQAKLDRNTLFRLPMNSTMFFLVSFFSGIIYYLLGGKHGFDLAFDLNSFILISLYILSYLLLNTLGIYLIDRFVYKRKQRFMTKDLVWEIFTTIITYPVGIAVYIMYQYIGLAALILIGVPFITLSLILKLYHSSQTANDYLRKTAEIGHQLSQNLYVNETVDFFIEKLYELFKVDFVFIHQVNFNNQLEMISRVEQQEKLPIFSDILQENEGISGRVLASKKLCVYHSEQDWKKVNKGYMPNGIQSVLCVPLIKNNKVIGVLLLGNKQKKAFVNIKLMVLDLLCTQFAIALENAKYFEQTKENSEKCALTKLYNYRYFEKILSDQFMELKENKLDNLALIMLDIDHFKSVNDLYGHPAGNEILKAFAKRIENIIGAHGVVARYGGEEFVILLTNISKTEALDLAEFIRKMIASRPFVIQQNIDDRQKIKSVNITASLGLAYAPEDADESLALIRHADRALYVGAKRAGRNRVGSYVK
ncbi:cyclic diguanylate phosphodiesterase domain-containing protein [Mycobacteroides abscessus subsp. abscessus]|nr:cyclic diguanylate phosphodiesterase domain-containing protein [Mycobacteroides abscessus subsp. abscessus]